MYFSIIKHLVYLSNVSEYPRVICLILLLKYFGPNIQHTAVVENIVADTLITFPSVSIDRI